MASAVLSPSDAAELRALVDGDPAPSLQVRTEQAVLRGLLDYIGTGTTVSARNIPLRHRYEMRTDAIIAYAHLLSLISQLTAKWRVRCRNPQKAAFVDAALRRIYGRLVVQSAEARYFGWQALVKEFGNLKPGWEYIDRSSGEPVVKQVWDEGDVSAVVWEPFVMLRPETVTPAWDAAGRFDGIKLGVPGPFSFNTVPLFDVSGQQTGEKVPLERSLWVAHGRDGEFGSVWGAPRTQQVYKFWKAYEAALAVINTAIQRKGDPMWLILFPSGASRWGGKDVDNQVIAQSIARNARSGSVLTMPSEMYDRDEAGSGSARKWDIVAVKFEDSIDKLQSALGYFDVMKFRAMAISELSVAEGAAGSSSRNVAAVTGTRSDMIQFAAQIELDDVINQYMIPQLCEANFPELRDEPAEKETLAFGDDEAALAADLLRSIANANPDSLPIDKVAMLQRFNIDVDDPQTIVEAEKRAIEASKESTPPPAPAKPQESGVDQQTGFYYGPRERIVLSDVGELALVDDEKLLNSLPPTKHYSDAVVLTQMRAVRKLWFGLLAAQYEDFAAYISDGEKDISDVGLADDDQSKRVKNIVERIVSSWRYNAEKVSDVVTKTRTALAAIFARAGEVEAKSAALSTDDWKPDEAKLVKWVSDNAAKLVRGVEKTTRKQLGEYLLGEVAADKTPKQIADGIRAHFAEFPAWRADLIAKSETSRYYNAATLFAAEAIGVDQVQALDARLGEHRSDKTCIARNGKLYGLEAAWREMESEHPRGTLAFRLLQKKIALEYFPRDPENDVAARSDREQCVVYLRDDLGQEEAGLYLLKAVDYIMAGL